MWDETQGEGGNLDDGKPMDFGDDLPDVQGLSGLQAHPPAEREKPMPPQLEPELPVQLDEDPITEEVISDEDSFMITEEVIARLSGMLWQRALAEGKELDSDVVLEKARKLLERPSVDVVAALSQEDYEGAADLLEGYTFNAENTDPHLYAVVGGTEEANLDQEPEPSKPGGEENNIIQFSGKRK